MNERIKQLIKQADAHAHNRLAEIGGSYLEYYNEKFAELIVKECANIDFRHNIGLSGDQSYEVSSLIEKHFGV